MKTLTLAIVCLSALAPACDQTATAREAKPPSVVLICMDTVRADHLGCYGYEVNPTTPVLDELASRSFLFEDVTATACWTKPSVPSYLTGTYPAQHGVYEGSARGLAGTVTDILPEAATTLAEVFRERGFQTAAFVHNAQLRRGNGFEQGFDVYEDGAGDARDIRWRALDWLDAQDGDRPFFLYLHILDAHWPYPVPEEYATLFATGEEVARFRASDSRELRDAINDGDASFEAEDRRALEALYDGSLRYVDTEIGTFLRGLEVRGLDENTIVSVVSDHGEEFGEHERIGHGHGLFQNLLRVPWILHVPGRAAARIDEPVSLVDLHPTLVAVAGIGRMGETEGVNRLIEVDHERPVFAEHKAPGWYQQSLQLGREKFVRRFTPPSSHSVRELPTTGDRWEAELVRTAGGALLATSFKPRDEPTDDPTEIKGVVSALDSDSFTLEGIAIAYSPAVNMIHTEGAEGLSLADGVLVKVRGELRDGTLLADRIKLYGGDAERVFELRGVVVEVEHADRADPRVLIGGFWVQLDDATRVKDGSSKLRMTKQQVAQVLELGEAGVRDLGYSVTAQVFEVRADGQEEVRAATESVLAEWNQRCDVWVRGLIARRSFSDSDTAVLGEDALDQLRAIGYAR